MNWLAIDGLRQKGILWSRQRLNEEMRKGAFPRSNKFLGETWWENEIDAWIDSVGRDPDILRGGAVGREPKVLRGDADEELAAAEASVKMVVTAWRKLPGGVRVRYVYADGTPPP